MVIAFADAKAAVLEFAARHSSRVLVICDECTIESASCWAFVLGTEDFVVRGDASARLYGGAPLLVNRETGKVSVGDTAWPVSKYVEAYEALGADRYDAGEWRAYLAQYDEPWEAQGE